MKKHSLIVLLLLSATIASAGVRTISEAFALAGSHLTKITADRQKAPVSNASLQLVYTDNPKDDAAGDRDLFYVFNRGINNGFVIVPAEDQAVEVLGYADSGSFDAEKMPDGLRYWLGQYRNELIKLIVNTSLDTNSVKQLIKQKSPETIQAVAPLLGGIKWNQNSPFNDLCPVVDAATSEKAASGCVATGMAQVMRYYKWPVQGVGSYSYTTSTLKLAASANFGTTSYDWANMTDTYSTASTNAQNSAVATLVYHCGVAVDMDYNKSSGAQTSKMGKALIANFGYDADIQMFQRDYYTRSEWMQLIKTELAAARPVLYSGADGAGSGHLFVCDGIDTNEYLHFNWGWGGLSDGYFKVTALTPGAGGIGAGSGEGYNYYQTITVGVQKPDNISNPRYAIYMQGAMTCSTETAVRNSTVKITTERIYNLGINAFAGYFGLALFQNGSFVNYLTGYTINNLNSNYGYSKIDFSNVAIPTYLTDGNYQMYPVYRTTAENDWKIIRGKTGTGYFMDVNIAAGMISFKEPNSAEPALKMESMQVTGNIYQNKTARFKISLKNNGLSDYNSDVAVYLQSSAVDTLRQKVTVVKANIIPGETVEYSINGNVTLPPGNYLLQLYYDSSNNPTAQTPVLLGGGAVVDVKAEPTGTPVLSLAGKISFTDNTRVMKNNAILKAQIVNSGGFFENMVIAFIFPKTGGSSVGYFGYQNAIVDAGEILTLDFKGEINLTPDTYQTVVYYYLNDKWNRLTPNDMSVIAFNLVNDVSAIGNLSENTLKIYPNPAVSQVQVDLEEEAGQIRIFDLNGSEKSLKINKNGLRAILDVNDLSPGFYWIQVKGTKLLTGGFIKK